MLQCKQCNAKQNIAKKEQNMQNMKQLFCVGNTVIRSVQLSIALPCQQSADACRDDIQQFSAAAAAATIDTDTTNTAEATTTAVIVIGDNKLSFAEIRKVK